MNLIIICFKDWIPHLSSCKVGGAKIKSKIANPCKDLISLLIELN
jgi:hypothetical protein